MVQTSLLFTVVVISCSEKYKSFYTYCYSIYLNGYGRRKMRFFIFTERDREVLQAELGETLDKENPKDMMLLAVLKNRIKEYRATLLEDVKLMDGIVGKFNLNDNIEE